ncbi:MAG: hypothetical protein V3U51_00355 [Thermoplasmata archaeon]
MSDVKVVKELVGLLKSPVRLVEYLARFKGKDIVAFLQNGSTIEGKLVKHTLFLGDYAIIVETISGNQETIRVKDISRFVRLNPGVRPIKMRPGPAVFSFMVKPEKRWEDTERLLSAVRRKVEEMALVRMEEPGPSLVRFSLDGDSSFVEWTIEIGEMGELREEPEFSSVSSSDDQTLSENAPINGFVCTSDVDSGGFKKAFKRFSKNAFLIANAVSELDQKVSLRVSFALLSKGDAIHVAVQKLLSSALPQMRFERIQAYVEMTEGMALMVEEGKLVAYGAPEDLWNLIDSSLGG